MVRRRACLAAVLALAGCAHRSPPPAPLAIAAPEAPMPQPELPAALASITPPPLGPDGRYRTINSDLTTAQAVWHVRAALNVAAIGCRGAGDAGLVPAYNAMLTAQKATLAEANRQVQAGFRATGARDWQADSDAEMTRLYNFFAMPAAKTEFCEAADAIAPRAAAIAPDAFTPFAVQVLPQLEAPFLDVFAAVDRYRTELAAWTARQAGAPQLAAAAPMPASTAPTRQPALAYADLGRVLAWEPHRDSALALR